MGRLSAKKLSVGTGLKLGVIASSVLDIAQYSPDLSRGFLDSILMAFTTESNIWVAAVCFMFLGIDLVTNGKRGVPQENRPSKKHALLALVMPLAYLLFFFAAYELTGRLPVPDFFLDYETYGWLRIGASGIGVVHWVLVLVDVLLGIGVGVVKLRARCQETPLRRSITVIAAMLGV